MGITNFLTELAGSQKPEVLKAVWLAVSQRFPGALAIHPAHRKNDKLGVDYFIEFEFGKMERLDVKIRKLDYSLRGDDRTCCLECVANSETGKPGWTLDPAKLADWIMFLYVESGNYFFYRADALRAVVGDNLAHLRAIGKPSTQTTATKTGSYTSETLFVDHRELGVLLYKLDRGQVTLSKPKAVS